ncbi:MAG TPA: hypothetical protein VFM88_10615 [Vicinamibacteria bacterium]|nr:hypothetical protein [Vicinamibacteria bacterium]
MQSSLYTAGLVDGEALDRLEAERKLCVALARKHHLAVFDRVRPRIEGCDDPTRLKAWALATSDLSDSEFLSLLGT